MSKAKRAALAATADERAAVAREVRERLNLVNAFGRNRRAAADLGLKPEGPHGPASLDEDEYR
jgi:hypothetical protein